MTKAKLDLLSNEAFQRKVEPKLVPVLELVTRATNLNVMALICVAGSIHNLHVPIFRYQASCFCSFIIFFKLDASSFSRCLFSTNDILITSLYHVL